MLRTTIILNKFLREIGKVKTMGNGINDFRELAKKLLDQQTTDHETLVKSRIVPLLLGPYDLISIAEMEEVKNALIEMGYSSSIKVQDIQTKANFDGKLDLKFSFLINSLQTHDYFVIPIFYFPKREEGKRMGHHAEFIETTLKDYTLILAAGLFYEEKATITHHQRVFLYQTCIKSLEDYKKGALNHINKFFPIIEKKMMHSTQEKSIYTEKKSYKEKGGKR
ncbi:MAG: hypothetical protein AABY40_04115 [Nanoarchaeota archaeon]